MAQIASALIIADQHIEEGWALIMKQENVNGVEKNSLLISTQKQKPAPDHAEVSSIGIKAIRKVDSQPVYNMEVDDNHNFAIADGLIVHNCMDALRYFVNTEKLFYKCYKKPSAFGF
jgi:hypothetical protein